MLEDRQPEEEVDGSGLEGQGVDVRDEIHVGRQRDVHADDARVVEGHVAAADLDHDLCVRQGLEHHAVQPRNRSRSASASRNR
jgi:hypothetical protein